jgi:hypothetical protein
MKIKISLLKQLVRECIAEILDSASDAQPPFYILVGGKVDWKKTYNTYQEAVSMALRLRDTGTKVAILDRWHDEVPMPQTSEAYGRYAQQAGAYGFDGKYSGVNEEGQPEPYDDKTDTFQPSPRDRTEPVLKPEFLTIKSPKVQKALGDVAEMKPYARHALMDRARKAGRFFPDSGTRPDELNLGIALQYIAEHPPTKSNQDLATWQMGLDNDKSMKRAGSKFV